MLHDVKPLLDDDLLMHYGVKGMKWGVRKGGTEGVSRRTDREASKDAKEFARAKMFYGEGAGTRRKLIKAKVDTKSRRDPNYAKAFDNHLGQQNMGKHAERARGERGRKDKRAAVRKTANSVNRRLNGPFAGSAAIALVTAGVAYAQQRGIDKTAMNTVRSAAQSQRLKREVNDLLRRAASSGM